MRVALSMPEVVEPRTLALSMGTVETDAIRTETQLPPEWPGVRGVRKTARASGGRNSGFRLATSIRCLRVLASLRLAPACEERRSPTI